MSPQRLLQQVRSTATAEPATLGAVVTMALATVVNGVNVFLFLLLLVAFIADQISGILKAIIVTPKGAKWYDGQVFMRGAAKKGLIVVAVLVAASMDMALTYLPAFGDLSRDLSPVTKIALVYFLIGQWTSALRNVAVVKDARAGVEFMIRRMDAAKLGHEPPLRRDYDAAALKEELTLPTNDGRAFRDVAVHIDRKLDPSDPEPEVSP